MSGNVIFHHLVEPRVKRYSPREESFPIPLKYIDVSRTTSTNLDVKQERRIDDCWNIDGSRDLPDSWTGFTQFTLLEEKPPHGYMWSGERLTRKQLTSRPDHLWPELWIKLGRDDGPMKNRRVSLHPWDLPHSPEASNLGARANKTIAALNRIAMSGTHVHTRCENKGNKINRKNTSRREGNNNMDHQAWINIWKQMKYVPKQLHWIRSRLSRPTQSNN